MDEYIGDIRSYEGRGAQFNTANPYATLGASDPQYDAYVDSFDGLTTTWIKSYPKTIVNRVKSPDVGMDYSLNPYQGCEHGCVYCYARNTHPYWGYSAGLDFESKILVKVEAASLLRQYLSRSSWKGNPIVLSGNTDCYQPLERKLKITRSCLEVMESFNQATGIITKNNLVLRDLDILKQMAEKNLVRVIISITTLDEQLRRLLEPRTISIKQRLQTVAMLAKEGIPTGVMVAPVIPGLNDHELHEIVRVVSLMGAQKVGYTMVRLNADVAEIFSDWIKKTMPARADKVLSHIAECHGGQLGDSRFGKRMRGEGRFAEIIKDQFDLAVRKHMGSNQFKALDLSRFHQSGSQQLSFDL